MKAPQFPGSGFRKHEGSEKQPNKRLSGYEDMQQFSDAQIDIVDEQEEIIDKEGNYITVQVTPFKVDMELSFK